MVADSLLKCAIDTRKELRQSVLLAGGNVYPGLGQCLFERVKDCRMQPQSREMTQAAWRGASIVSQMSSFKWLTQLEYYEGHKF